MKRELPQLITFDDEARSGKGTIVSGVKDYFRDELGFKPMLIDRGQAFRVLVVAATRAGVNLDDPARIDEFLNDETNVANCAQFVKDVYHMEKSERDALLYTNEVGENSAKVGARAASQEFVANLTKKWLHGAGKDGYNVVLIDGRALEAIAREMDDEKLCEYRLGLYFISDATVGARRTLGYANVSYNDLTDFQRKQADELIEQINTRNKRDFDRDVEKLIRPVGAQTYTLPNVPLDRPTGSPPMLIFDTSSEMTKNAMITPVAKLCAMVLKK